MFNWILTEELYRIRPWEAKQPKKKFYGLTLIFLMDIGSNIKIKVLDNKNTNFPTGPGHFFKTNAIPSFFAKQTGSRWFLSA